MGSSTPYHIRQKIVEHKEEGHNLAQISRMLEVPYTTVRGIWQRYEQRGQKGLSTDYSNCGPKDIKSDRLIYRSALWLKRLHPSWGAPYIRTILEQRYTNKHLPSERTMQKWFRSKGYNKPRVTRVKPKVRSPKVPHDCWQIDAKEMLKLGDGSSACYLTIVDVESGAILDSPTFPPGSDQSSS